MATSRTILIAEDNVSLLKALTIRLESVGFTVIPVQDGYQALDRCRRDHPDIMLLDINLPAGDGLSVQDRMRKTPELASVPVVYMTGDTSESIVSRAYELGAVAVIHKPIKTDELLTVLQAALDSRGDSDAQAA